MGIGEQDPGMFTDRRWRRLGLPHARYLTAWDALEHRRQRAELDAWMAAARAAGARVTLSFKHSHRARRDMREFPTKRSSARQSSVLSPLSRCPRLHRLERGEPSALVERAAAGARREAVRRRRPHLRRLPVVGAHARDISGMTAWVRAFLRHAKARPRIWGLHNYVDVRNRRSTGTLALLAAKMRGAGSGSPRPADGSSGASTRTERSRGSSAARGGGRDAARAAPGMPEPAHPAGLSLQLAGAEERAEVQDDVGLGPDRPIRSAAPGL